MFVNIDTERVVFSNNKIKIVCSAFYVLLNVILYFVIQSKEFFLIFFTISTLFFFQIQVIVLWKYLVIDLENRIIIYRDIFRLKKQIPINSESNFHREKNGKIEYITLRQNDTRLYKIGRFDFKYGLQKLSEFDFLELIRNNFETKGI